MRDEVQRFADRFNFMNGLAPTERETVLEHCELRRFAAGEMVYEQDTEADGLFGLVEGEVSLVRTNRKGHAYDLARLKPGDVFGEVGVMDGGGRLVTTRAITDARALYLSGAALTELMEAREPAAMRFVHLLSLLACRRIRDLNKRIVDAIYDPGATRSQRPGAKALSRADSRDENFFQGLMSKLFTPPQEGEGP